MTRVGPAWWSEAGKMRTGTSAILGFALAVYSSISARWAHRQFWLVELLSGEEISAGLYTGGGNRTFENSVSGKIVHAEHLARK